MSYIIPKTDIPQESYFPVKIGEIVAMMTITPTGPVIMFPEEVLYVPWVEIATYAMDSDKKPLEIQEPPKEPVPKHESAKAGIREVKDRK